MKSNTSQTRYRIWYKSSYGVACVIIRAEDKKAAKTKFAKQYKNAQVMDVVYKGNSKL